MGNESLSPALGGPPNLRNVNAVSLVWPSPDQPFRLDSGGPSSGQPSTPDPVPMPPLVPVPELYTNGSHPQPENSRNIEVVGPAQIEDLLTVHTNEVEDLLMGCIKGKSKDEIRREVRQYMKTIDEVAAVQDRHRGQPSGRVPFDGRFIVALLPISEDGRPPQMEIGGLFGYHGISDQMSDTLTRNEDLRALIEQNPGIIEMKNFYVREDLQHQGIGTKMWNYLHGELYDLGVLYTCLINSKRYEGMRKWYEEKGYQHAMDGIYRIGPPNRISALHDAAFMFRSLDPSYSNIRRGVFKLDPL